MTQSAGALIPTIVSMKRGDWAHEKQGKTIVLITHSNELAAETPRIITISDGNIIGEKLNGEKGVA